MTFAEQFDWTTKTAVQYGPGDRNYEVQHNNGQTYIYSEEDYDGGVIAYFSSLEDV